jgi:hypothetical protein
MSKRTTKEALKYYDNLLLWTSLILTALLILIYYFADIIFRKAGQTTIDFVQNIIVEFLPIGATFIISYFIFRKVQELKEKEAVSDLAIEVSETLLPAIKTYVTQANQNYQLIEFTKINWEELLSAALKIDIIVHYFDTWIRNNDKLLEDIFSRNGTIRILVPNEENKSLVKTIKNRFPEYEEKIVKAKIHGTKEKLSMIKNRVNKGTLEIYESDELGYYCGIKVDEKYLVYSSYDHIRNNMRIEAPTFIIRIDKEVNINNWFSKEFDGLVKG